MSEPITRIKTPVNIQFTVNPGTHYTMWKKGNVEVVGAAISRAIRASSAGGG